MRPGSRKNKIVSHRVANGQLSLIGVGQTSLLKTLQIGCRVVKLFVAVTDRAWFELLSASAPDEVNFWQPSGATNFRALQLGELFPFKLHSPNNFIVGGGVFSHASNVPLSMAWEAFGTKNGVGSLTEMRKRIAGYRKDAAILHTRSDPSIGCRILTRPLFWPRDQWIPTPKSFAVNTVVGKGYATDEGR